MQTNNYGEIKDEIYKITQFVIENIDIIKMKYLQINKISSLNNSHIVKLIIQTKTKMTCQRREFVESL